jgi:hypothetical protein
MLMYLLTESNNQKKGQRKGITELSKQLQHKIYKT